jgi:nicotinate phosphoribosyltransferase
VGERLITAKSSPVFGGVYKLAALEKEGEMIPKMKISENVGKITNPGFKTLYRFFDKETHHMRADLIMLDGEPEPEGDSYEIFDPMAPWKRKTLTNFYVKNLRVQLFEKGELVYDLPHIDKIRNYCALQISELWEEMLRFEKPQTYYVDLSQKLYDLKQQIISEHSK